MDHLWLIVLLIPIPFVVPFVITMKLLAFFSGWEQLAISYGYPEPFSGKIYYRKSARIKWTNYKNCLQIGVNDEGLYIKQLWIFRLFHDPLLIPWEEIEPERSNKLMIDGFIIRIISHQRLTIFLYGNYFQQSLRQLNSVSRVDSEN